MLLLRPSLCLSPLRISRAPISRPFHTTFSRFQVKPPKLKDPNDPFTELEQQPRRPVPTPPVQAEKKVSRAHAIVAKLPGPLRKYGERLVDAPFAHVSGFLILHEFTAVVPFLGLWYLFHEYHFLPADIPSWILVKSTGVIERILGDTVADYSIQDRTKLIIEGATAYGIVKATFPLRVMLSLFCTPWFARVFVQPSLNGFKKLIALIKRSTKKK